MPRSCGSEYFAAADGTRALQERQDIDPDADRLENEFDARPPG
jgi:hypothetical protein